MPETSTHPSTALLVMDMQNAIVERFAAAGVLERAVAAATAARAHGVPVIFVRVAFRPGHPEVSPRNRAFAALAGSADLDLGLTVLRDACADADDEVHRVLTEKVFPRQAEVVDVAAWTAALAAPVSA